MKTSKISILICAIIGIYITSCQVTIPNKFSQLDYAKEKDAEGYYTFVHGKYKGALENNVPHGIGEYIYNNGIKYQGTFTKGNIDGQGRIDYPAGGSFVGETLNGILESGELVYDNGDIYKGSFKDGKRYGEGKLIEVNGNVYEGFFRDDKLNGRGIIYFVNGDKYEGWFNNSKLDGQGKITLNSGDRYEGEFKDNELNGDGFIVLADGTYAQGSFTNHKLNGKGYLQKSNGDILSGRFDSGILDGEGSKYIQTSDEFIMGKFSYGRPDGDMIVKKDGIVEGEIFESGENITQQIHRNKAREELNRKNERSIDNEIAKGKAKVASLERDLPDVGKEEQLLEQEKKESLKAFKNYAPVRMESNCRCVLDECKSKRSHDIKLGARRYYCPKYQDRCGIQWEYLKYNVYLPDVWYHRSYEPSKSDICESCSELNKRLSAEAPAIIKKGKEDKRICEEWKRRGPGYDDFYLEELEKVKSNFDFRIELVRDKYRRTKKNIQSTKEANKKRVNELKDLNKEKIEADIAAATQRRKQALNQQAQKRFEDLEWLCNQTPDACPCWALNNKKCESLPKNPCSCSQ